MPQERVGSHLLGLLNPAMVIAGNLIAIPLVMENSAWAPFVASIGAIWMLGLGPLIETLLGDRPPRVGASNQVARSMRCCSSTLYATSVGC